MDNNKILEWKKKHGDIYKLFLKGSNGEELEIIYKALSAKEVEMVQNVDGEIKREEEVCRMSILNGINIEQILPGHLKHLSSKIIDISIIPDEDTLLQKAMENRNNLENNLHKGLILRICRAFPFYTPDILLEKNIEQLLELTAMAEVVTGEKIISTDPKDKLNSQVPLQPRDKWSMNESKAQEVSMEASTKDLASRITKESGKSISKFKPKKTPPKNPLHAQMSEMKQMMGQV